MPEATKAALNIVLPLASLGTYQAALAAVGNQAYRQTREVAAGVKELAFKYDVPPPLSRAVTMELTFGDGPQSIAMNSSAAPRASAADKVVFVGGHYILAQ
jgi:hypothetical protein